MFVCIFVHEDGAQEQVYVAERETLIAKRQYVLELESLIKTERGKRNDGGGGFCVMEAKD